MKGTEQPVHRNQQRIAEVDPEELVVEVVIVVVGGETAAADDELAKAAMSFRRSESDQRHEIEHVYRRGWNDPQQQRAGKINQMLDRMHRQAGPWTRVYIGVMQTMNAIVQRLPVKYPVARVEVHGMEEHQTEQQ